MEIAVVGVSHKKTPINIRENLSFSESMKIDATEKLLDLGIDEVIILATCNRSEIYISSDNIYEAVETVEDFFEEFFAMKNVKEYLFTKVEDDAMNHLYNVCLGMDSAIVGEDQILGQVKDAMINSMQLKSSKKILNQLFRTSITLAKKVKSDTRLSENPISVSYIGVKNLKDDIGTFEGKEILVIGLGKMGLLALKHLEEEGARNIVLCNRKYEKSLAIQKDYPFCEVEEYENMKARLKTADIVISATASPHILINKTMLLDRENHIYILDLALPRDIDDNVTDLDYATLYNVDTLEAESQETIKKRRKILEESSYKIDDSIEEFKLWRTQTMPDVVLKSLNERCIEIKDDTLSYIYRKVPLDHRHKKVVDKMVESALKRMIREPILNLKQTEEEEKVKEYIKMLNTLFEFEK